MATIGMPGFRAQEILQRLEPISLGHEKVRDQHVGGSFFVRPHGALPVCNGFHFVTFNLQRNTQDGPQVFVVVGHQNASHWGRLDKGVQMLFVPAKTPLIHVKRRGRSPAQIDRLTIQRQLVRLVAAVRGAGRALRCFADRLFL